EYGTGHSTAEATWFIKRFPIRWVERASPSGARIGLWVIAFLRRRAEWILCLASAKLGTHHVAAHDPVQDHSDTAADWSGLPGDRRCHGLPRAVGHYGIRRSVLITVLAFSRGSYVPSRLLRRSLTANNR
ncbi:MAG: hypothetical protein WAM44_11380, partial [Chthoniobacterales bacterium]